MATKEARDRAIAKYQKEKTTQLLIRLNFNTDADIIGELEKHPSKMGYVKELIRADIEARKKTLGD